MSIWNLKEDTSKNRPLTKDIKTDILIIGAGMTGMTTAYYLSDKNICVVDSSRVGHGVSLNTTAKINYFQERIYTKIAAARGTDLAIKYLKSQKYAIDKIKKIIKTENIDCDFKKVPSYVFANVESEVEPLIKEIEFLKSQNIEVIEEPLNSKITYYKSFCVKDTYIFNPIKYLRGLQNILNNKNIPIYENTKIINIYHQDSYYICETPNHIIKAQKVVFAGHYPYFNLPFFLPIKSYMEKSHIIVSRVEKDENFTCISSNIPTYSCRFYNNGKDIYQVSLSMSHNTAFKQNNEYNFNRVKSIFNLKDEDIVLKYSNSDIITPDHMPYIGPIKENFYLACGYNTWGMTNSVLAANIISDAIQNKPNEFAKTFSPKRITLAQIIQLPYILFSQTKSFLGTKINKNKNWYNGKIHFFKKDGNTCARYTDELGETHTIIDKCPHLGCNLIFNEKEESWDCPCHSSRFDLDGKCIKGPSNYDISYKENDNE